MRWNMIRDKLPLCSYAVDDSYGCRVIVKCTLTNEICPMIRWCPVHNCPRMNDKFTSAGCKLAKIEDAKRKEGGN